MYVTDETKYIYIYIYNNNNNKVDVERASELKQDSRKKKRATETE